MVYNVVLVSAVQQSGICIYIYIYRERERERECSPPGFSINGILQSRILRTTDQGKKKKCEYDCLLAMYLVNIVL